MVGSHSSAEGGVLEELPASKAAARLDTAGLRGADLRAADAVSNVLAGTSRLGVAYSGGVDSATLLALAVRTLGPDNVVALMGVSPSLAASEREAAHDVAAIIGAPVVEIETHEGENEQYIANDVDRCYFCKDELFTRIDDALVAAHRLDAVAYGENADDAARPDRPGARAATEHRVLRPLAEAGLDKARVRSIARALRLPCADKPAAPCLASRIPHGHAVTPQKLRQVENVEQALRDLGFADSRVRHHDDIARIELPAEQLARSVEPEVRAAIHQAATGAGFRFAAVDLKGMQSGAFTLTLLNQRGERRA